LACGSETDDARSASSMTRDNNDVIKSSDIGPAGIE
jgi:hypothetical protein